MAKEPETLEEMFARLMDDIKDSVGEGEEREIVFESMIEPKEHLWQYDDHGKAMLDAIYNMLGGLCVGCQLKALSMICGAITCDIKEEGQESFKAILFKAIDNAIKEINEGKPRPN